MRTVITVVKDNLARGGSFLLVGGLGFLVDASVYNALVFWGGRGALFDLPLLAKVTAVVVASVATYLGSHFLTYRDRQRRLSVRTFVAFIAINALAIGLQLSCLAVSRYVLGLSGPVADNVSGTLIGQVFATAFRYVAYGRWVFPDASPGRDAPPAQSASTS